ncbi:YjcZ family sporulation protein [Halalkalibacter akibai]|nr:YjcZ family sporulation protein [Halalkalibacter akibai]
MTTVTGYSGGFPLIVVLFILLVIVGASWAGTGYGADYAPTYGYGYGY